MWEITKFSYYKNMAPPEAKKFENLHVCGAECCLKALFRGLITEFRRPLRGRDFFLITEILQFCSLNTEFSGPHPPPYPPDLGIKSVISHSEKIDPMGQTGTVGKCTAQLGTEL